MTTSILSPGGYFNASTELGVDMNVLNSLSVICRLKEIRVKHLNKILIGHLNINSIRNKFDELVVILNNTIDILVISETKIDDSFPTNQFMIPGYQKPFRLDRNDQGGGILVYVRNCIPAKVIKNINLPSNIETIFFDIVLGKKKWLISAS